MALASINGWMAVFIQENISKTKNTVMEYSSGKTEGGMSATGPMANSTALAFTKSQMKASRLASGNLVK